MDAGRSFKAAIVALDSAMLYSSSALSIANRAYSSTSASEEMLLMLLLLLLGSVVLHLLIERLSKTNVTT